MGRKWTLHGDKLLATTVIIIHHSNKCNKVFIYSSNKEKKTKQITYGLQHKQKGKDWQRAIEKNYI